MRGRGDDRALASRQTVRQTEAARKHGKGRLTNCFCPLWEGAARHGLVWALTFRRVKSDPRRREEEMKRGWEEWKKENWQQRVREPSNERESKWGGRQQRRQREAQVEEEAEIEQIKLSVQLFREKKDRRLTSDWQGKQKLLKNQTNKQTNKQIKQQ